MYISQSKFPSISGQILQMTSKIDEIELILSKLVPISHKMTFSC